MASLGKCWVMDDCTHACRHLCWYNNGNVHLFEMQTKQTLTKLLYFEARKIKHTPTLLKINDHGPQRTCISITWRDQRNISQNRYIVTFVYCVVNQRLKENFHHVWPLLEKIYLLFIFYLQIKTLVWRHLLFF